MGGKHWLTGTLNLYGLKLSFQVDKVNTLVKRSIVNIVKRMFSFHSWEGCDFCPCLGYVTIFIPNSPPPPEVHFATFVCVTVMPRHFADLTIPLFFAKSRFLQICAFVNLSQTIKFCKNSKNLQIWVSEILQIWGAEFLQIWLAQSLIFCENLDFANMCSRKFIFNHKI